jgi:hypothetical protein
VAPSFAAESSLSKTTVHHPALQSAWLVVAEGAISV